MFLPSLVSYNKSFWEVRKTLKGYIENSLSTGKMIVSSQVSFLGFTDRDFFSSQMVRP